MAKVIAICLDNKNYVNNFIFDKEFCKKEEPWLDWTIEFKRQVEEQGHIVKTGDLVKKDLEDGSYNSVDVMVISDGYATPTAELLKFGATPFLIYYLEAPIVAPGFYDKLSNIIHGFNYRVFYGVAFEWLSLKIDNERNFRSIFSRYHENELLDLIDWNERKSIVMIAANKYYKDLILCKNPFRTIYRTLKTINRNTSRTYKRIRRTQLHDKRLQAINYFAEKNKLDLFGHGWNNKSILPRDKEKYIRGSLNTLDPKSCADKIEVMRHYKFALCFENQTCNGYITEKIIDCFVAGVIPIYYGAPDIEQYVDPEAFIDGRNYKTYEELEEFLNQISEETAKKMIELGRQYIRGYKVKNEAVYSHEGYARMLAKLVDEANKEKQQKG